jgi:hypothetical protein
MREFLPPGDLFQSRQQDVLKLRYLYRQGS